MSSNIPANVESANSFGLAAIEVSGRQAGEFLQAQLTGDIDGLAENGALQAMAWCRPDGRAEIVVLIARLADGYILVLPRPLLESASRKLRMFSIGRDVKCAAPLDVVESSSGRTDGDRLVLAHDRNRSLHIVTATAAPDPPVLSAAWLAADVRCGMPWLLPATSGLFLPQMLGLEVLGGLSYRKGCFPGQEVIARVHYRGRVTRRLCRIELDSATMPEPGLQFDVKAGKGILLYLGHDPKRADRATGLAVLPADLELPHEVTLPAEHDRVQGRVVAA
ncbi:MAG: YgfZ/GcvT domain-containing protein [Wenzhouxiangellaceae bacterium]